MENCRVCRGSTDFYANAKPGQWSFGVCKVCCRKEYHVRKVLAQKDPAQLGLTTLVCSACRKSQSIGNFAPCHIASASLDFTCRCKSCESLKWQRRKATYKEAKLLDGLV